MNDVVLAKFDYSQLDRPESPVKLRLNSTGLHAANVGDKVEVTYMTGEKMTKVRAGQVVMAGYNMMIPYRAGDVARAAGGAQAERQGAVGVQQSGDPQLAAVHQAGRARNLFAGRAVQPREAGLPGEHGRVSAPARSGSANRPAYGVRADAAGQRLSPREQSRKGRALLLGTPFEVHEQMIREQLQGMLGEAGFDHQRDIQAITVNRWSHGYSYFLNGLFDDEEEAKKIIETARQPIGKIVIANSDSDWSPYANSAIDQAWRAVNELAYGKVATAREHESAFAVPVEPAGGRRLGPCDVGRGICRQSRRLHRLPHRAGRR